MSIPSNSYMPIIGSSRASAKDMVDSPPPGQWASRQYTATENEKIAFAIETAEGDTVTLNYQISAIKKNYLRPVGTEIDGLEDSNSIVKKFTMNVDGELNEQEKEDIAKFMEQVESILDEFISTNSDDSSDTEALDFSMYKALKKYAMAIDSNSTMSWASEMVVGVAHLISGPEAPENQYGVYSIAADAKPNREPAKEGRSLQVDSFRSPMQQKYGRLKAQNAPLFSETEILVQQKTDDKHNRNSPISSYTNHQSLNLPNYTKLGKATQNIFARQVEQLENETIVQKLNVLEKGFYGLMDQLDVKKKEVADIPTIVTSA